MNFEKYVQVCHHSEKKYVRIFVVNPPTHNPWPQTNTDLIFQLIYFF